MIKSKSGRQLYIFPESFGLKGDFSLVSSDQAAILGHWKSIYTPSGLHKLWYPGIRDTSTWSKFGAHGEHGDVFLFSNLGAL